MLEHALKNAEWIIRQATVKHQANLPTSQRPETKYLNAVTG